MRASSFPLCSLAGLCLALMPALFLWPPARAEEFTGNDLRDVRVGTAANDQLMIGISAT